MPQKTKKTDAQKQIDKARRERLELAFETQLRQAMPGISYERHAHPIPGSKYEADFLIDGWLAVEVQGGIWKQGGHSTGTGIERDVKKLATFLKNGYILVQLTGNMIDRNSSEGIDLVQAIYKAWLRNTPAWARNVQARVAYENAIRRMNNAPKVKISDGV